MFYRQLVNLRKMASIERIPRSIAFKILRTHCRFEKKSSQHYLISKRIFIDREIERAKFSLCFKDRTGVFGLNIGHGIGI